jgi:hypothetical protein
VEQGYRIILNRVRTEWLSPDHLNCLLGDRGSWQSRRTVPRGPGLKTSKSDVEAAAQLALVKRVFNLAIYSSKSFENTADSFRYCPVYFGHDKGQSAAFGVCRVACSPSARHSFALRGRARHRSLRCTRCPLVLSGELDLRHGNPASRLAATCGTASGATGFVALVGVFHEPTPPSVDGVIVYAFRERVGATASHSLTKLYNRYDSPPLSSVFRPHAACTRAKPRTNIGTVRAITSMD